MDNNDNNAKLDWMYKSANSLVDREEYLLGRSVDKTLEQLNAEEKEKKLGIVPPKNHVEHECIPPSIRDFNKIVQAEQVDITAKLQEDPLVAIKKREEEARRQFLQNPVQLKKLQEALKAQELKKKAKRAKSKDDSDSDIDRKIVKKLKYLNGGALGTAVSKKKKKKSKDKNALDTILMHKFNQLKDKLSQEDLNDILSGKISDSDEEVEEHDKRPEKYINSSRTSGNENNHKQSRREKSEKNSRKDFSRERSKKKVLHKRYEDSSDSSSDDEIRYKQNIKKTSSHQQTKKYRRRSASGEDSDKIKRDSRRKILHKRKSEDKNTSRNSLQDNNTATSQTAADFDLENKILEKLRMLRNSSKSRKAETESDSDNDKEKHNQSITSNSSDNNQIRQSYKNDSDSDDKLAAPKSFGLVKADGTKIALNKKSYEEKKNVKSHKEIPVTKPDKRNAKKLTEKEKEEKLKEMMKNAEKRDKERSDNLKKYREEDKREETNASNFDKDFMRKQLLRSTKEATVESRIKSNLNNIQRSSRHMDSHFSRR